MQPLAYEAPVVRLTDRIECGGKNPLVWIAGPCVIESADGTLEIAERLAQIARELDIPLIFKASFDKANRSSGASFRGPGMEAGLEVLGEVRRRTGLPVTTDIHEAAQAAPVGASVDVIQIPAFLARQTDLLLAAGRTGKAVNVKKGQFMAPAEMRLVVRKLGEAGNERVLLTERGTFFGYGNLVADLRSLPLMRSFAPVCFDATHSVQQPAAAGDKSGGDRRLAPLLARAAVACGCDAIFMEVHPRPDEALSDGPNIVALADFPAVVKSCLSIRQALGAT
jgi:2-dehydro-3-deoxyphosphooctonate aldolase (KDO 8-P synthase)